MVHPENCIPIIKKETNKEEIILWRDFTCYNVHLIFEPIKYTLDPRQTIMQNKKIVFSLHLLGFNLNAINIYWILGLKARYNQGVNQNYIQKHRRKSAQAILFSYFSTAYRTT